MISYRQLTLNDSEQFISLVKSRPETFNGYTDTDFESYVLTSIPRWLVSPKNYVLGLFAENVLSGVIVALESDHSPSWSWAYWITKPGFIFKLFAEKKGLDMFREADSELFYEMEVRRKLNRFFVSYRSQEVTGLKSAGMSDRLFEVMRRHGFQVARYKFITDCVIEPGEMAKYSYQRALVANRIWPIKLEIRMGILI